MELLAAPTVDRTALEQLRVAQIQSADARRRRVLQAMADAAEVLTPEQRVKAAERLKKRWSPLAILRGARRAATLTIRTCNNS